MLMKRPIVRATSLAALCLLAAVIAGCSEGSSVAMTSQGTPPPSAQQTEHQNPPSPTPSCPVPDSGRCLGMLASGRYTTSGFRPILTYRVPNGWSNYLDVPGGFLLMPPGAQPPGELIAGDFISVVAHVAAEASDCSSPHSAPGVGRSASDIVGWMRQQRDLTTTKPEAANIGGLRGKTLEVRMTPGAKGCLAPGATKLAAPLLVGTGPFGFDHEIGHGILERDYVFDHAGSTVAIEVIDTSGGAHLTRYLKIVKTFRFSP